MPTRTKYLVIEKSQKSSRKTRSAFFRKFFGRVATEKSFLLNLKIAHDDDDDGDDDDDADDDCDGDEDADDDDDGDEDHDEVQDSVESQVVRVKLLKSRLVSEQKYHC